MNPVLSRKRNFLLLAAFFSFCEFNHLHGQSLEKLSDSLFRAIRSLSADSVVQFTPSYRELKLTLDTVQMEKSESFILIKEKTFKVNIRRQYLKLLKNAKNRRIDIKKTELLRTVYEEGKSEQGVGFAYIRYRCKQKNKMFTISVVAINCAGVWRIADELELLEEEEDK